MRHLSFILHFAFFIFVAFGCVHGETGVDREKELVKAEKHNLLCKDDQKFTESTNIPQDQVSTQITGGLTAQEIVTVIRANLNDVKKCYEKVLDHNSRVKGKAITFFVIGKSGRVHEVCFYRESELIASSLYHCIREDVKDWKFPMPRKEVPVKVVYPFIFSPK
jgi:hypothetical protein